MKRDKLVPLPTLQTGHYRYYKGGTYFLHGIERDASILEARVRYQRLGDYPKCEDFWSRPLTEWEEKTEWSDGVVRPKFCQMGPIDVSVFTICEEEDARILSILDEKAAEAAPST